MPETSHHTPDLLKPRDLKEAIAKSKATLLEIGTAARPMTDSYPYQFDGVNNTYVAWNIDPNQHVHASEQFVGTGKYAVYCDTQSDITEFIEPKSVDMVVIANMIGEPEDRKDTYSGVPSINPEGDKYSGSSTKEQKQRTLSQAFELLKSGGELVVFETISPDAVSAEQVRYMLDDAGFSFSYKLDPSDGEEFTQTYERYANRQNDLKPGSYIVIAGKV